MKSKNKSKVSMVTIDDNFANQRIDNFLVTRLKTVPKTRIYRLIRKGEVRVNKKRVLPSYKLQLDDQVRIPPIEIRTEITLTAPPRDMIAMLKDRILFEDAHLMIINKPAGLAVHGGTLSKWGVVELLRTMYPEHPHLELAHRIDFDTSGCLILVKKRSVLREIHDLLREGKVKKEYLALTLGHWKPYELEVDAPLRKNVLKSGERMVRVDSTGKEALTLFEPMQFYKQATLVKARLVTGRTHQIRVHAAYRGHPIAQDGKYGDKTFNKQMNEIGLKRLFLHSHTLEFTLASGQRVKVEAPLAEDLAEALKKM